MIWDVGHQTYPHKILTGQARPHPSRCAWAAACPASPSAPKANMTPSGPAIRSTSISAGLGMALARDLADGDNHVVAVIGDSSMSAGMAYEALNQRRRAALSPDRHSERQRHVDRPADGRDVRLSRPPGFGRRLPLDPRGRQTACQAICRASSTTRPPQGRGVLAQLLSPAARCSRSSASIMSGRSTATISNHLAARAQERP